MFPKIKEKIDGILSVLWVLMIASLVAIVLFSLFPYSPLRYQYRFINDEALTMVVPQGWGFFTKDPQEPRVHYFVKDSNENWKKNDVANSDPKNLYGLSRLARLRGVEYGTIIDDNKSVIFGKWERCNHTDISSCITAFDKKNPIAIKNTYPIKTFCGKMIVIEQKPNSWAYYSKGFDNGNEINGIVLDVDCD
jgi:uncharacterized protein yitP